MEVVGLGHVGDLSTTTSRTADDALNELRFAISFPF